MQNAVVARSLKTYPLRVTTRNLLLDPSSLESANASHLSTRQPFHGLQLAAQIITRYAESYQNRPKYGSLAKDIDLTPSEGLGP